MPGAWVVANAATGSERGAAFAARHGIERTYDSMAARMNRVMDQIEAILAKRK